MKTDTKKRPGGGPQPIHCPHCGSRSAKYHRTSTHIYGRDYGAVYHCEPCNAYVGVHANGCKPKGSPATYEWREARKRAHAAFDPIWKSGTLSRGEAYRRLALSLGIQQSECHIGMFDPEQCEQVVCAAKEIWAKAGEVMP